MSYTNLGDFNVDGTAIVDFDTFDNTGLPVTITGLALADIKVYKDGGATARSSTAGFTLLATDGVDIDGITGIHGFSLDLSDNTDAGFWAAGSDYKVVVDNITVNSITVSFIAAIFSIENRHNGTAAPTAAAVADQVWDEAFSGHVAAGSFGLLFQQIMPQQNQAFSDLEFLMVDSTDKDPATGLTVTGERSIDGGSFAAVTGTIAEVGNGIYQFDASAADMNGTVITFRFSSTGADDTFLTIKTRA